MSVVINRKNMPETIELLVIENNAMAKPLRKFVAWFDRYEREWGDEYRDTSEFLDLRDIRDAARASLLGVA